MRFSRTYAAFCICIIAAGCAGGNQTAPIPITGASKPSTQIDARRTDRDTRRRGSLIVRIHVPREHHHNRRAHYISAATRGLQIALTGTKTFTQAVSLTRSSPDCSGSPLVCTVRFALPAGTYTATLDAYDQAPAGGKIPSGAHLLSTARDVPVTITLAKANSFDATLDGVPGLFDFSLPSAAANTAFSHESFSVVVKDADGNVIVGGYETAVTLHDGDSTGATSIETAGSDNPPASELLSSEDTASISYSGLAIAPATITATAGATHGSGQFAPTLYAIVLTSSVVLNSHGAVSPASFSASENGWTNAPYNKTFTATPGSGCSTFASVTPATGVSFTASLVQSLPGNSGSCTLTLADGAGQQLPIALGYQAFSYTGAQQSFVVPAAVATLTVIADGAQGEGTNAGLGGSVTATIPVASIAETVYVYVGGQPTTSSGGFNGGGASGGNGCNNAGGGASDLREGGATISGTDYRVVVAGGGGGGGCGSSADGGSGGGAGGGNGSAGGTAGTNGGTSGGSGNGAGGSGGGGGNGSSSVCVTLQMDGDDGTLGQGGAGGNPVFSGCSSDVTGYGGSGGGGGYYGGGGGGAGDAGSVSGGDGGGGGGGGAFAEATASNVTYASGTQSGNGQLTIAW